MTEGAGAGAAMAADFPSWARMTAARREHALRVAGLMEGWAVGLDLPAEARARWRLAALHHDALKDAPAAELRPLLSGDEARLAAPLLHGPAAAARMEEEGIGDPEVRDAVRHHTVGHPSFRLLGQALYLADWLEPGRGFEDDVRRRLRSRLPGEWDGVLREVTRRRIGDLLEKTLPLRPETVAFWNARVVEGMS